MNVNKLTQQIISAYSGKVHHPAEGTPAAGARPPRPEDVRSGEGPKGDELALSDGGRELQRIRQLVVNAPDVREERVAELRAQVQSGTYRVAVEDLARQLLGLEE